MNKINIKGRLTKDVTVKETATGKVVTFTLADELRRNGEKAGVQYVNCAARGAAADVAEKLAKGAFVNGDGYLKVDTNKVEDKYYTNVTVWVNKFNEKPADAPANADKA